jgi:hypothetical protein
MCPNALLRTARAIVPWAMPLLLTNTVQAQVTNVDIDLAPGSDADQMEVRMRFNGSGFGEVFSGLVFTIRWDASSPALLPLGTPFCTGAAFPIGASPHVEDGGYRYRTWNMEGMAQLQADPDLDGGCGFVFPAGEWVTVLTITPINNAGCTSFQIVNDAYTTANNRNFYLSLNGQQNNPQGGSLTGSIEPTPVQIGACAPDCAGVVGGTAYLDNCGTCVGGNTGLEPCVQDCNGDWGGNAYLDNCNTCVGGNTGLDPCVQDCNGDWGGNAYLDNCSTCVGGNTGEVACVQDCNGDWGGTAYIDNCGDCVGGDTGAEPCTTDCAGVPGGNAYLDNCGTCVGGNTGAEPCTQDCNGDWGGTAYIDNCGDCVGGSTGEAACAQDCAGEWGGTALPGTACNDNDPCTTNDTWNTNCQCVGEPITLGLQLLGPDTVLLGGVVSYTTSQPNGTHTWQLPVSWSTSDATAAEVTVTVGGTPYSEVLLCVSVTVDGCVEQVCMPIWIDAGVGMAESLAGSPTLAVFPNPTNGSFHVTWEGSGTVQQLEVFDPLGRRVMAHGRMGTLGRVDVDLTGRAAGTYLVKLIAEDEVHMVRLVLQH